MHGGCSRHRRSRWPAGSSRPPGSEHGVAAGGITLVGVGGGKGAAEQVGTARGTAEQVGTARGAADSDGKFWQPGGVASSPARSWRNFGHDPPLYRKVYVGGRHKHPPAQMLLL
jgi:hypothetical protein